MNKEKEIIVCFCEDITEDEIISAIEQGYTTPKEIKRHLRTGMGACQGRGCTSQIMKTIGQKTGKSQEEILPLSDRPPVKPVPLGVLSKISRQVEQKR